MGHDVVVLRREFNRKYTFKGACLYYIKLIIKKLIGRQESWHYYVSQEKRDYIARETNRFIGQYINPRSKHLYTTEEITQAVADLQLEAIIVGSDQVWRPDYSPCQPNFFLDFLPNDSKVKRISYAASFGRDDWSKWSPALSAQCAKFLQKFDAVSVREESGIRLCKEHFGVDAVQVLDPTMLLKPADYAALAKDYVSSRGTLFCYVLDRSEGKRQVIQEIACRTGKQPFESLPEHSESTYNLYGDIDKSVYPPVEKWLSAFIEAEMVVTDSFHGTVFSIINNKPFWVLGNEGRGMARFQSLLALFGLENRLISASQLSRIELSAEIDWNKVNKKRKDLQNISIDFIKQSLS